MNADKKKYIIVLLITVGIFIVVFGLVSFLNNKKIAHVGDLQRKITVDLLATETQFELLKTAPCDLLNSNVLSQELGDFGNKLDLAESNQGSNDPDVLQLKKYYSLLQVKDYLLTQELADKCNVDVDSLLYFYGDDCPECTKQGYVLTEFKKQYPELRIYSFDTDLDFSVIETFTSLYDFGEEFPTIIVGEDSYQGLQKISDLEELFPDLKRKKEQQELEDNIIEYIAGDGPIDGIEIKKLLDNEYEFTVDGEFIGSVVVNSDNDFAIVADKNTNES